MNDQLIVNFSVQLNSYEISKIKKLAESSSNNVTVSLIRDVTDILKKIIAESKEKKIIEHLEHTENNKINQDLTDILKHMIIEVKESEILIASFVIVRFSLIKIN